MDYRPVDGHHIVSDSLWEEIAKALAAARGQWRGCDWRTEFGQGRLNLNGLRRSQATLMARATAGSEAADWRAAAAWLEQVEHDAQLAESKAQAAAGLARSGRFQDALEQANLACAIEARYHPSLIWQPLRRAIEAALPHADTRKSHGRQPDG